MKAELLEWADAYWRSLDEPLTLTSGQDNAVILMGIVKPRDQEA